MRKLLVIVSIVMMISYQIQNGIAFDPIGTASNFMALGQFLVDVSKKLNPPGKEFDPVKEIIRLNGQVLEDTKAIIMHLENLPNVIRIALDKQNLANDFNNIKYAFEEAVKKRLQIENGQISDYIEYEHFSHKKNSLDDSFNRIIGMFTDSKPDGQNYIDNLKTFEEICETHQSEFQLLDRLLANIKFVTAQYFWACKFMYDFLEIFGKEVNKTRLGILETVENKSVIIARKFKNLMVNASTVVWKCDPRIGFNDSIRSINNTNSNFAEMRAFSKYIIDQRTAVKNAQTDCGKYPCEGFKKIEKCENPFEHTNLCPKTRLCPGNLFCDRHPLNENGTMKVCVNTKKTSPYRYHMILQKSDQYPNYCDRKDQISIEMGKLKSSFGGNSKGGYCYHCNCVCEEDYYEKNNTTNITQHHGFFVENNIAMSNISLNKIVVGARLVVELTSTKYYSGNFLRIQIREATLLANGIVVDEEWKELGPILEGNFFQIQWNGNRRFYLSPVMVGKDEVITGLAFDQRDAPGPAANDFILVAFAQKINFTTGLFDTSMATLVYRNTATLTKSFPLSDVNVPTRSRRKNDQSSSDDQYVDLSLTSDVLDGGQSVVPFIDTQKWSVGTPLVGASLYVRYQEGFGGFLSLKFWTFNTFKYIKTDSELLSMNEVQHLNLTIKHKSSL